MVSHSTKKRGGKTPGTLKVCDSSKKVKVLKVCDSSKKLKVCDSSKKRRGKTLLKVCNSTKKLKVSDSTKKRRGKTPVSVDKLINGTISDLTRDVKVMDVEKWKKIPEELKVDEEELRRYMFPCLPKELWLEEKFAKELAGSLVCYSDDEFSRVNRVSSHLGNLIFIECSSGKYQCEVVTESDGDDYEEVGGEIPWHKDCLKNVVVKFFVRFFNGVFPTIVAFGKDGRICSLLAHRLPYSHGAKAFPVKGDLLEEVSFILTDYLARYDDGELRYNREPPDIEELHELRRSWAC